MGLSLQADGKGQGYRCRVLVKRQKARLERRRAKRKPDCRPGYGKYDGWML